MSQFQFVMRSGPNPGKVFPVEGNELTIGRDTSNPISINDAEVSRKHAKMELRGSSYVIQDLGSTNGTFVNGSRISGMQVLNPNDIVSFGENIALMYEAIADANATMISSAKAPRTAAGARRPAAPPPPPPAPAYSGQVPAGPAPAAAPAKKSGSGKIVLILILVGIVCLILGCVALLWWIDSDPTGARWCQYLPFVAQWLGAVCP
jgi:hypothetical protein